VEDSPPGLSPPPPASSATSPSERGAGACHPPFAPRSRRVLVASGRLRVPSPLHTPAGRARAARTRGATRVGLAAGGIDLDLGLPLFRRGGLADVRVTRQLRIVLFRVVAILPKRRFDIFFLELPVVRVCGSSLSSAAHHSQRVQPRILRVPSIAHSEHAHCAWAGTNASRISAALVAPRFSCGLSAL
jgi:hypothetical protein